MQTNIVILMWYIEQWLLTYDLRQLEDYFMMEYFFCTSKTLIDMAVVLIKIFMFEVSIGLCQQQTHFFI